MKATVTQNLPAEKVGVVNHVSASIHKLELFFDAAKSKKRKLYYFVKHALLALLA